MSLTVQPTRPSDETTLPRWETALRIVTIASVAGLVLASAFGLLGVRTAEAGATDRGLELTVRYAAMTRPGLATPFSIDVRSTDGSPLPDEVTIKVSSNYLAILDDNGMEPMPSESFNTAVWTWWTFAVPEGEDTLTVDLDARLEPAVQWGRSGEVGLQAGDEEVVSVEFTTRVAP